MKTNIGHLDAAAGAAGLIKTVLAVEHGELPPTLHFTAPNPRIDFAATPFYVSAELRPWPTGAHAAPRRRLARSGSAGPTPTWCWRRRRRSPPGLPRARGSC